MKGPIAISLMATLVIGTCKANRLDTTDCKSLNVNLVNNHADECEKLTPECLSSFTTTGLNQTCLSKFKESTLNSLASKTAVELMEGDIKNIPKDYKVIQALIEKAGKDKVPKTFAKEIAKSQDHMDKIFTDIDKFSYSNLAVLLTEDTMSGVSNVICARISKKEVLASLEKRAFRHVKPGCLAVIEAEAFAGIDEDFMRNIRPESLTILTDKQAEKLTTESVKKITVEQARNWGPPTSNLPPVDATDEAERARQVEARKEFVETHPCQAALKWLSSVPKSTAETFNKQCKPIWSKASDRLHLSITILLVSLFSVLITVL